MLILTRRAGQTVQLISRDTQEVLCTVHLVLVTHARNVQLGFDAPPHVQVLRDDAKKRVKTPAPMEE